MKKIAKLLAFLVIFAVVFVAVYKFINLSRTNKDQNGQNPVAQKVSTNLIPAIDGVLVSTEMANLRPIAVMVENHPDARPQSGLSQADLVYETVAEGGITRFMAVFQTQNAKNIGPVRSARTYFADLANELDAVYAHVGGNSDVLENIKNGVYKNIGNADQFFNDPYFWRTTSRSAPHNVYTSIDKLEKLIQDQKIPNQESFSSWQFKDDQPVVATSTTNGGSLNLAKTITVDFSTSEYQVTWKYDPTSNSYKRFIAGQPDIDVSTGKQITAKNIIVQFVSIYPTQTDTLYSIDMNLDGPGDGRVFLDGQTSPVKWQKQKNRTRYYIDSGSEISFDRGQTWVEIVPVEKELNLKWK